MKYLYFISLVLLLLFVSVEVESQCTQESYPVRIYNNTNYVTSKSQVFKIGIVSSLYGSEFTWILFQMVTDIINNSTDLLPDVRIELYFAELAASDANTVIATQYLIKDVGVKALIGGTIPTETNVAQLFARIHQLPQVVGAATSSQFNSKKQFTFLSRLIPNDAQQNTAVANFLVQQGWKQVLVIYGNEDSGESGLEQLKQEAFNKNFTVYSYQIRLGTTNWANDMQNIAQMVERYRIRIFVYFLVPTIATPFFAAVRNSGFMAAKYLHIHTYNTALFCLTYPTQFPWCYGTIGIAPREGNGPVYNDYLARWNTLSNRIGWVPNPRASWYFADDVLAIAHSLHNAMVKTPVPLRNITGKMHMDEFTGLEFMGTTGDVILDEDLERVGSFNWFNFGVNYTQSPYIPAAVYDGETQQTEIVRTMYFSEGATEIYDGYCVCHFGTCDDTDKCNCNPGYIGETCNEKSSDGGLSTIALVLVIVLPVAVILIMGIIGVRYMQLNKRRIIKDISDKQKSNLTRKDFTLDLAIGRGASGTVYKGMFRGTEVAVKQIVVNDVSSSALEEFELESAVMAGLRHPNIVIFMGACMDPVAKEMFIVMEFLEKGSLHDILHNPKINVTFEMVLHIASQAAKGMNFLHQASPPIIHRDLKSHNILLDDKWNARIADFGITRMKDLTKSKVTREADKKVNSLGTIFWAAPEAMNGGEATEKSDCYSFGIVLWELIHRANPYQGKDPMSVALDVCLKGLRPNISMQMNDDYEQLMKDCWAQDPAARPTFQEISQRLRQLSSKNPALRFGGGDREVEAPEGKVVFVQTEVEGSSVFWDQCPTDMLQAITLHNTLARHHIKTYDGYEVESGDTNDSFLIAFDDLSNAINFCTSVQIGLLRVAWPTSIVSLPEASIIEAMDGEVIWNGLRVKMAISSGVPNVQIDSATGRTKYLGPVVQKVQKMITTTQSGISIIVTEAIADDINKKKLSVENKVSLSTCGQIPNTNRDKMETLYSLLPSSLEGRTPSKTNESPYALIDIDNGASSEMRPIQYQTVNRVQPLSWVIPFNQMAVKENVGRGAVGDYYHGVWNGKDVAIKTLINQKLEDNDLLQLKARVSELMNLVTIYGVCFDAGHISLVEEYLPNAGLPQFLFNDSNSLTWQNKIKIAKQIADGMLFLSMQPDQSLGIHANLKSGNIMINNSTLDVRVNDYGQNNLKDLGRTMTSVGTVAWTAPEILSGEDITPAISVYSFGIIMCEIGCRKVPYPNEHPIKLVAKIIAGHRPAYGSDFPTDYEELMKQCWAAVPSSRPNWSAISGQLSAMLVK